MLKNKLTRDEAKELINIAHPGAVPMQIALAIDKLEKAGIIRKSAEEKADELYHKMYADRNGVDMHDISLSEVAELRSLYKQAIAERAEREE
jgi:hypothetical protein